MKTHSISVIIPTYNREEVLCETLRGLFELESMPKEILVIDQTLEHTQAVHAYLEEAHNAGRIFWLRTCVPSLPRARNLGVQKATGDIVLFLDDDVTVPADLLARHLELLENRDYAAVCGQVYQPKHYVAGMEENFDMKSLSSFNFNCLPNKIREGVQMLRGCHFSVRREVYLSLEGFDEAFVGAANGEESDFANRLTKVGKRIVFDPDCFIVHWKIPSGGCRIVGNRTIPEWKKTASMLLYGMRYFRSKEAREHYLWASLKTGPFRLENLRQWWRFPGAICAYFRSVFYALRYAKARPLNTVKD